MASSIHVGDVGTAVTLTVEEPAGTPKDISSGAGVTATQFEFRKPDGTDITKNAPYVTNGVDGKIKYVSESGFFDLAGAWRFQGIITLGASGFRTNIVHFFVKRNL